MELLKDLQTEELIFSISSSEVRKTVLPFIVPLKPSEKTNLVESSCLNVLSSSSLAWRVPDDKLGQLGLRNALQTIVYRMHIPFKNPLLERIRQIVRKTSEEYGQFNVIHVEPNQVGRKRDKSRKVNAVNHHLVCSCGCDRMNTVNCNFPWNELLVYRKLKQRFTECSTTAIETGMKTCMQKGRNLKKTRKAPSLRCNKMRRKTLQTLNTRRMFQRVEAETKKEVDMMLKIQRKQKEAKNQPCQSETSCCDQSTDAFPQFQPYISNPKTVRDAISLNGASQIPMPLVPQQHLQHVYNANGTICDIAPLYIWNDESKDATQELKSYPADEVDEDKNANLITKEEQQWLETQLDSIEDRAEPDLKEMLLEMDQFMEATSESYLLGTYLNEFDRKQLYQIPKTFLDDNFTSCPHGYASLHMDLTYEELCYQNRLPCYGDLKHDCTKIKYPPSVQNQPILDPCKALQGLLRFRSDWLDTTTPNGALENHPVQSRVGQCNPTPVFPPPGFTIEDRNQIKNKTVFEALLSSRGTERQPMCASGEKFEYDISSIRNEMKPDKSLGDRDHSSNVDVAVESEGSKTSSICIVRKNKAVRINELPKLRAETAWRRITAVPNSDVLAAHEVNNEILENHCCLPSDLEEFPTLNQAYRTVRPQLSKTATSCRSEKLQALLSETTLQPNSMGKKSTKLPVENTELENAEKDNWELDKLTAESTLRTLFSFKPKRKREIDEVGFGDYRVSELQSQSDERIRLPSEFTESYPEAPKNQETKYPVPSTKLYQGKIPGLMDLRGLSPYPPEILAPVSVPLQLTSLKKPFKKSNSRIQGSILVSASPGPNQFEPVQEPELPDEADVSTSAAPWTTSNKTQEEDDAALQLFNRLFADPPVFQMSEPVQLVQLRKYVKAHQTKLLDGKRIISLSEGTIELKCISNLIGSNYDGQTLAYNSENECTEYSCDE